MYLVVCPGGEATLDTLVNFFRNLSITFKVHSFWQQYCVIILIRLQDLVVMFLLTKATGMKEL